MDNCGKNGVYLESQYYCSGLFADDIVLVAPSKQALNKKILNKVHEWAIKNEMTFGINKCATLVKPIDFVKPINYEDPSFFIDSNKLPKTDNYTYLDIPFDESLSLKPLQSKLNSNLNIKLNLFFRFLINKFIPLPLKKYVLIFFILSLVLYYAPLFGSNKSRCSKAQKIINRGVMDLNLVILMLVFMILLVNWEYLLFLLSVLYLNYAALENGKTYHVLLIISLIIFLLCHITHGLKNQGLWIKN